MPFSLRLTADLGLALAARAMRAKNAHPLILQLSPAGNLCSASASFSDCDQQRVTILAEPAVVNRQSRSPIIWIGGSEPLDHPAISRFTNELAAAGRHVFLQTSGLRLKPRLHEFQPSNRFYFAVCFDGFVHSSDGHSDVRAEAFRGGIEAIRMARLAGFFTCAHLVLHKEAAEGELNQLHAEIHKLDVDGFLITCGEFTSDLERRVVQLRRSLLGRRWALLSSLLDSATLPATSRVSQESEQSPLRDTQTNGFGEGAEA
jgi:hypothetical protein